MISFLNITGTYHAYLQGKYNLDRTEKSTNFNEFHRNIVSIIYDSTTYIKKRTEPKIVTHDLFSR